MLGLVLAVLCTSLANAAADPAIEAHERAVLMQAQGINAELNNDPNQALTLLQQASALAPDDANIAFDLARVSFSLHSPTLAQDSAHFLALPPEGADAQVLRAYLLAASADSRAAERALDEVLRLNPSHPEALLARSALDTLRPPAPAAGVWAAKLRLSTELDSNVQLLPSTLVSGRPGWRLAFSGAVSATPVRGTATLDLAANVALGVHLLDRADLKPYDTAGGSLWATFTLDPGPVIWTLDAVGTLIFAGEQTPYFMGDAYGQTELRVPMGPVRLGVYGLAGWRPFDLYNVTRGPNDRTGPHYEAGILAELRLGQVAVAARGGYLLEQAHGVQQQVRGTRDVAYVRWTPDPFIVQAAMGVEWRDYWRTSPHRVDLMLEPSAQFMWAATPVVYVVASYAFVNDASLAPFTYQRHLGEIGVEARW